MAAPVKRNGTRIIPSVWPERILKRDFHVVLGKMLQPEQAGPEETEEPYLRSANIQWGGVDISDVKTMWFSPGEKRDLLLKLGDLLVNEGGDVGRSAIWKGELSECYFQNAINRVRPRNGESTKFLYYWLLNIKEAGYIDAIVAKTTIAHLTAEKLEGLVWTGVPAVDQRCIAAFLDANSAALDGAIAVKQQQISILNKLRDDTVWNAVTRGVRSSPVLRPSGIDWLPEVPSHWKVQQMKRRCTLIRGLFTHRPRNDPALYDGSYPFVQTGNISAAEKYITTYSQTLNELGFSVSRMFPRGTLVMSIAANVGDVAILDFEACFPDSMIGLVPNHQTNLDFLYFLLRSMKGIMLRSAVLTTQYNLNYVRIGTNYAPFPPRSEQEEIAEFIDGKTKEIRDTEAILERQISTLVAYRKSLIHECVTGQRRVTVEDLNRVLKNG
jgi:type I restriction enzyme S subunit